MTTRNAIITGASRGLGLATARALAGRGWNLVIDARGNPALEAAADELAALTTVLAVPGDVTSAGHRNELAAAAQGLGGLDLLVNNASMLGPSPQPPLAVYPLEVLRRVYETDVLAPLALIQLALPPLRERGGTIVNITSDAASEGYAGWGGYGSAKAALNELSHVLAAEEDRVRVLWFDPGDMNTQMHQEAFPGEDISDRPLPEASVPSLLQLLEGEQPSGWYRASRVGAG
jgi:NAD(P)-dependent dehydrogenase (short-subunit alcohol dehydrogenase family)